MAKYMTKQRAALLDYLQAHAHEALTTQEIADALTGAAISTSAVYRNLAALEEAGEIRRLSTLSRREAVYQFAGAERCRQCLHLSCKRCGHIYHMDSEETERFIRSVAACDQFEIDKAETILYGVCKACKGERAQVQP